MGTLAISALVGYLLGSIPFGYILIRAFRKTDVREVGSGSTGATNVLRSGGTGLGFVTLLLDTMKGAAAVFFAMWLNADVNGLFTTTRGGVVAVAAIAAIVGHCFPVWLGFHGGKGVATALGIFLAISTIPVLCALGVFILVAAITRYVSLASIVAVICFPIFGFWLRHPVPPAMAIAYVVVPLIVVLKHHSNIRRLIAGTESRFGKQSVAAA